MPRLRTAMVVLSFIVSFGTLKYAFDQSEVSRKQTNILLEQTKIYNNQTIISNEQTKINNRGVTESCWQAITQQGNDISRIFVDHPKLRPYFYDGKSIKKSDHNYAAVMSIAELYLDYIDSMQDEYVFELPGMAEGGENRKLWDRFFKDMFSTSPALCSYATEKQNWYSPGEFDKYMPIVRQENQKSSSGRQ